MQGSRCTIFLFLRFPIPSFLLSIHSPSPSLSLNKNIVCQHLLRTSSLFYFPWIIVLGERRATLMRSLYLSSFFCLSFSVSPCPRSLLIADVKADQSLFRIFRR